VNALDSLRSSLQLKDGWRTTYPTNCAFSFLQTGTGVQSCIDRIYASDEIIESATDWNIEHSAVLTDHKMISVNIVDPKNPFIGRGRWTMPMFLLKDESLIIEIHNLGLKFEQELDNINYRSSISNPQLLFQSFKNETIKLTRDKAKGAIQKMKQKINKTSKRS
jgi:hypothetical protein